VQAEISLTTISTPIEKCVTLRIGQVAPISLNKLQSEGFDQAPVLDLADVPIGILATTDAARLLKSGEPLRAENPAITKNWTPEATSVGTLLAALRDHHAALVGSQGATTALVTASDLNRHNFRRILYGLFAELEAVTARLVDLAFTAPKDWIRLLSDEAQVRVFGFWELAKSRNVDVGPIAGTMLTDLLRVVSKSQPLLAEIKLKRSELKDLTGELPDWRNRVMHPVRPLVLSGEEVKDLARILENARALANLVRAAVVARGVDWRSPLI
jgi:hypothetical protein